MWCLQSYSGTKHVYVGLHDAALLLLATSMAVRGNSARILRWSDLFMGEVLMNDVCAGKKVPVSAP